MFLSQKTQGVAYGKKSVTTLPQKPCYKDLQKSTKLSWQICYK